MRPDEDMHAAVEEVELEPCDFFTDVGTLIIEGRVPGLTEKGFGEGPHCPPIHGQNRHICDSSSPNCQQQEQLEKHMLLLWKNGIPMSVEVLLYPDCCRPHGRCVQVETSAAPEVASCILLEQWTLHMLQRRVPDASINPRSQIQAVRSFLHFSQLSAWLSLGKGKLNTNVHYRVCVPGEAFSSKFEQNPDVHTFPISNIGRSHAMKIQVKSLPRQGEVPKVPCSKHDLDLLLEDTTTLNEGFGSVKMHRFPFHQSNETEPIRSCVAEKLRKGPKEQLLPERKRSPVTRRESSLGDSLLDPSPSLHMYPKRYQSPSRCGSPSLEMPEHLMFGSGATAAARREADANNLLLHRPSSSSQLKVVRDRSRPQRQPVIERFLKKEYGVKPPTNNTTANHSFDRCLHGDQSKKQPLMEKGVPMHSEMVKRQLNLYPGEFPSPQLPQEEMHLVLDRLRHRFQPSKLTLTAEELCQRSKRDRETEGNYLFMSMKHKELKPNDLTSIPDDFERIYAQKSLELSSPQMQITNAIEETKSSFDSVVFPSPVPMLPLSPNLTSTPIAPSHSISSSNISEQPQSLNNTISGQQYHLLESNQHAELENADMQKESFSKESISERIEDSSFSDESSIVNEPLSATFSDDSSSLLNECRTLETVDESEPLQLTEDANSEDYLTNSELWSNIIAMSKGRNLSLLYKMLRSNINLPILAESPDRNGHLIPSAAEKLKFRRSLDSATSMVFHQNTGLPLTSSPAPVRKSGTCFDFDSSLTTVSAIKKALFEKDPDWQETTKHLLSTSAPASTTTNNLLGNFEESVLNGRLEPVSTVEGFTAEIGASGSFCPRHKTLPVTVFFYTLHDTHKVTSPYLGHINLGRKGYNIPKRGTVQVTLFNPHGTVVKMFVVCYDLTDMPPNSQTFLRQRTLYMPTGASEDDDEARKWLRYLIHLRFASSKSGKVYLHTDMRMIVFRKSDLDAATIHGQRPYELRSFTQGPENPKFSPCK